MKKQLHMIMQAKGGVGKSFISTQLTQYFMSKGARTLLLDLDPATPTSVKFKGLPVKQVNIMDGMEIDGSKFDQMVDLALSDDHDITIVDNGASNHMKLFSYLTNNKILQDVVEQTEVEVFIHTVVMGGQEVDSSFINAMTLCEELGVPVILWVNEFRAPAILGSGKPLMESNSIKKMEETGNLYAILRLPHVTDDARLSSTGKLNSKCMTYDEALASADFSFGDKGRLRRMKDEMFALIDGAQLLETATA